MAAPTAGGKKPHPVTYDADHKLLAFLGPVAFVLAALLWSLLALRLAPETAAGAGAAVAAAVGSGAFVWVGWALRVKMDREIPVTAWELRRLLLGGLVLGVAIGALPYLVLRFKLHDPDFAHIASEPANVPPALR